MVATLASVPTATVGRVSASRFDRILKELQAEGFAIQARLFGPIGPALPPVLRGFIPPPLFDEVWNAPLFLVEKSPPVGKAISGVASQLVGAAIVTKYGHAVLLLPYEAGVGIVWFASGPLSGARTGLQHAAEDAFHEVGREVLTKWLRDRSIRPPRPLKSPKSDE